MTKTDVKLSAYTALWLEVIEDGDLLSINEEGSQSIYLWNGATVLLDDDSEEAVISYPDGSELEVNGDVERWIYVHGLGPVETLSTFLEGKNTASMLNREVVAS